MSDDLTIKAGGKVLGGWIATRVSRGCERVPSDFDVQLTELFPGQAEEIVIKPGDTCQVMLGGDLVLTGYIDRYTSNLSPSQHIVRISGRSKCQDLVDCSAGIDSSGKSAGMRVVTSSLLDMATQLSKSFGITVSSLTGDNVPVSAPNGGGPAQFNFILTETPFEIIERVARYAGVLVYDGTDGNLILAKVGATTMASGFSQGVNVQTAAVQYSMDSRYSLYQPSLMSTDMYRDVGGAQFQNMAPVKDSGVPRFRPLIVVSEQVQNGQNFAIKRAQWEAARRRGRSQALHVVCDSWRDSAGALWSPNALAKIDLPALKLQPSDPWAISEVTFTRDQERGTAAELVLMPKEAFIPEPSILQPFDWQIAAGQQAAAGAR